MEDNSKKIILHLFADIGSDSKPYRDAGYDVRCIGSDIGVENFTPPKNVYGIIANPPCKMFSIARMSAKTPRDLREGMRLVKEALRVIWECQYEVDGKKTSSNLKFWAIENPASGMLKHFLGNPTFEYSPHEYGADWTKRTALWGMFNLPKRPLLVSKMPPGRDVSSVFTPMNMRNKYDRMNARSNCYEGFANAFFRANQ